MIETLMIPDERKAVLIGENGRVKKELEKRTQTTIIINEEIKIQGDFQGILYAKEVIKAVGRGFSPSKAFNLLKDDYQLYIINLRGKNPNTIKRLLARVIGKKGSTRMKIENYTGTYLSIYGKTISIIGEWEGLEHARNAIEHLLSGKPHTYVYKMLKNINR